MEGEAEKLRKVLSYCKRSKEIHVIYLTGPEAGYAATTGKTLLVSGILPVTKVGRQYFTSPASIQEFLKKNIGKQIFF